MPATLPVTVWFGATERKLQHGQFSYTADPNVTSAGPTKSFLRLGPKARVAYDREVLQLSYWGSPGLCVGGCEFHAADREKSSCGLGWG